MPNMSSQVPRNTPHARQHAKRRHHPRAELLLQRPATRIFLAVEYRRRQVETDFRFAAEVFAHGFEEAGLRVQPRDFVLIFVTEQLEVARRHGLGKPVVASLCVAYPLYEFDVAIGKRLILVPDEELGATCYQIIQRFVLRAFGADRRLRYAADLPRQYGPSRKPACCCRLRSH